MNVYKITLPSIDVLDDFINDSDITFDNLIFRNKIEN